MAGAWQACRLHSAAFKTRWDICSLPQAPKQPAMQGSTRVRKSMHVPSAPAHNPAWRVPHLSRPAESMRPTEASTYAPCASSASPVRLLLCECAGSEESQEAALPVLGTRECMRDSRLGAPLAALLLSSSR